MWYDEATAKARLWWGEYRGAVRDDFNTEMNVRVKVSTPKSPALIFRDVDEVIPDGILSGKAWDQLGDVERMTIMVHWHHNFVREPMRREAERQLPGMSMPWNMPDRGSTGH